MIYFVLDIEQIWHW